MSEQAIKYYIPHNDEPVVSCSLGRGDWCRSIAEQIRQFEPPKAIAIHGTWGSGKTSALKQLEALLSENDKEDEVYVKTIWFEAWQYQNEENVVLALLKEIRDQLCVFKKILDKAVDDTSVAFMSLIQSFDLTIGGMGMKFGFKNIGQNVKENIREQEEYNFSMPITSERLKLTLQSIISRILKQLPGGGKKKQRKLVIFIDDLDRCMPDVAFKILESIKTYLNLNNCIFVLGVDQEAIERIIGKHYEKQLKEETKENSKEVKKLARLYLEKICQDIYHLPVMTNKDKVEYFSELLKIEDDSLKAKMISYTDGQKAMPNLLPPFPRSIKIYVNTLMYHVKGLKNILSVENENQAEVENENRIKLLMILTYLYAFHYEVYQLCYLYPGFYTNQFLPYCESGDQDHSVFKTISLPPFTKNVVEGTKGGEYTHTNLRQVLWIRDLVEERGVATDEQLNELKL